MGARGSQGGAVGILGGTEGILGGLNGIQGGTGVFLAEKFESPTRCVESLAPPIGPRPVKPVQNLLERMAALPEPLYMQSKPQPKPEKRCYCLLCDGL